MSCSLDALPAPTPIDDLPHDLDLRLVVADMDGTLLDGDGGVPARFPEMVHRLADRGVMFAPASGRQLANLRRVLDSTVDGGPIIAENGTFVVVGDEEVHSDTIDPTSTTAAVATVRELAAEGQDVGVVVAMKRCAYVERTDERYTQQCSRYYEALEAVPDVLSLDLADVLKVAVYSFGDIEREAYPRLAGAVPEVQTVVSGAHWTDMMSPRASKGRALEAIQERLGVTPAQTVVFGDYLNDLELYERSAVSFAMANAHPEVLAAARFVAPANTEDGVMRTLEALLDRMA